ncbi:Na+/H+ antiporter NhaC family protein [Gottschalkiaceae bacterium SANA]|nr:Na+/H+ antiporter NhaC family protein [Gottschalkiaceae bacterium SANA]
MEFGWLSILPPLVAIALAFLTHEVILSLFIAIFTGTLILTGFHPIEAFTSVFDTHILGALYSEWNLAILVFCLSIGGLIGILSKNGGTSGIADAVSGRAKNAKSSLFSTMLMGVLIFFDDYANSLIVGNTMRPITDRMKVSREKLAYIVDATAAPVSSIALVSTWVGMELGLIRDGIAEIGLEMGAYELFLQTIPYRFYSILSLAFVFFMIYLAKDFGPMWKAERRVYLTGKVHDDDARPLMSDINEFEGPKEKRRWINAVLPIVVVIGITLFGLYVNGGGLEGKTIQEAFGDADASVVLLWASFSGIAIAGVMSLAQRLLTLKEVTDAFVDGLKSMTVACIILVLAWTLGGINSQLGTQTFLVEKATGVIAPQLIPTILFILSALVAFSTGTSWGTNSIVMPIAIPLSFAMGGAPLLVPAVGSVLTGAVLGDHCSPVSDTTIMSSMASACDHMAHVQTQLPYALTVGSVAILVGFIPSGFGMSPWISLVLGTVALFFILKIFGKSVDLGDH